jgi:hypothetical protein
MIGAVTKKNCDKGKTRSPGDSLEDFEILSELGRWVVLHDLLHIFFYHVES